MSEREHEIVTTRNGNKIDVVKLATKDQWGSINENFSTKSSWDFDDWLLLNRLRYHSENFSFSDEELMFRIPINDFRLQLDTRIDAALSLLPHDTGLILCRRNLSWRCYEPLEISLDAVLGAFGLTNSQGVLRLSSGQRQFAFILAYLTNRWGTSSNSLFIIPDSEPNVMLYVPGSPESVFVITRSLEIHNQCVEKLKHLGVPAYGPSVKDPIPLPTYEDIQLLSFKVRVDPATGKPIGPGCDESPLLPEYLPPEDHKGKRNS